MLISQKLNDELNKQLALEFFADNQYLAMSIYFEGRGLNHLAGYFKKQAAEERMHGLKIIGHILDAGGSAVIPAVDQPQGKFASVEEVAKLFLEQEQSVTRSFYAMFEHALAEKDFATHIFLQWFVNEQLEEESSAGKLLQLVKTAGEANILQLDMLVGSWGGADGAGKESGSVQ
jgi:ferritin